jgi:hypothetical protein
MPGRTQQPAHVHAVARSRSRRVAALPIRRSRRRFSRTPKFTMAHRTRQSVGASRSLVGSIKGEVRSDEASRPSRSGARGFVRRTSSFCASHRVRLRETSRPAVTRHEIPPFSVVNDGHNCQTLAVPCWQVVVSANSWASSDDAGPGNNGMGEWAYISHLQHGHWHYVGGWGEGIGLACGRVGIPRNVSRDLHVYCA